ncbi:hypothetical protein ACFRFL_27915 [Streptomyces sp. NPDC056708]
MATGAVFLGQCFTRATAAERDRQYRRLQGHLRQVASPAGEAGRGRD